MGWRERVRQFRAASAPRFGPADARIVSNWLTPTEQALFYQQCAYERQHSVALARSLLATSPPPRRELVAAALLHDLGKADQPPRRWQRVAFVCLSAIPGRPLRRLARPDRSSPWYSLWLLQHHPALGAAVARCSGVAERVTWLIEHHHLPLADADLRRLQEADCGQLPQSARAP